MAVNGSPDLYQLEDGCRHCGRRERRRLYAWTLNAFRVFDPETPVEEILCRCGRTRIVKARAYLEAKLDPAAGRH